MFLLILPLPAQSESESVSCLLFSSAQPPFITHCVHVQRMVGGLVANGSIFTSCFHFFPNLCLTIPKAIARRRCQQLVAFSCPPLPSPPCCCRPTALLSGYGYGYGYATQTGQTRTLAYAGRDTLVTLQTQAVLSILSDQQQQPWKLRPIAPRVGGEDVVPADLQHGSLACPLCFAPLSIPLPAQASTLRAFRTLLHGLSVGRHASWFPRLACVMPLQTFRDVLTTPDRQNSQ